MKYKFPLQKILDYRKMVYRKSIWDFSSLANEWNALESQVRHLEGESNNCFSKDKRGQDSNSFLLRERYYQSLILKQNILEKEKKRMEPAYLKEKAKVVKAFLDKDFMEKLAKSSFDAYKREKRKKERNILDEMVVTRYIARGEE